MTDKNKKRYYPVDKIKKMFKTIRKENKITDEEYELLCQAISCLPRKIVNKVKKDIFFVILSSSKEYGSPACWVNIEDLKDKKGIIFLAPSLFKHELRKNFFEAKITENDIFKRQYQYKEILHEVTHFMKDHKGISDLKKYKKQEDEAEKQAEKWLLDALNNSHFEARGSQRP